MSFKSFFLPNNNFGKYSIFSSPLIMPLIIDLLKMDG